MAKTPLMACLGSMSTLAVINNTFNTTFTYVRMSRRAGEICLRMPGHVVPSPTARSAVRGLKSRAGEGTNHDARVFTPQKITPFPKLFPYERLSVLLAWQSIPQLNAYQVSCYEIKYSLDFCKIACALFLYIVVFA